MCDVTPRAPVLSALCAARHLATATSTGTPAVGPLSSRCRGRSSGRAASIYLDRHRVGQLALGRLAEFAGRSRTSLDQLGWHGRRDIIRALVRRIEIDHDQVEMVFRIPAMSTTHDGNGGSNYSQGGHSPANRQYCGRSFHPADRRDTTGGQGRVTAQAPLRADRGDAELTPQTIDAGHDPQEAANTSGSLATLAFRMTFRSPPTGTKCATPEKRRCQHSVA